MPSETYIRCKGCGMAMLSTETVCAKCDKIRDTTGNLGSLALIICKKCGEEVAPKNIWTHIETCKEE